MSNSIEDVLENLVTSLDPSALLSNSDKTIFNNIIDVTDKTTKRMIREELSPDLSHIENKTQKEYETKVAFKRVLEATQEIKKDPDTINIYTGEALIQIIMLYARASDGLTKESIHSLTLYLKNEIRATLAAKGDSYFKELETGVTTLEKFLNLLKVYGNVSKYNKKLIASLSSIRIFEIIGHVENKPQLKKELAEAKISSEGKAFMLQSLKHFLKAFKKSSKIKIKSQSIS